MLPATHLIDAIGTSYFDLLAAAAGCTIARPNRDYGVDGTLQRIERWATGTYVPSSASVDFQLKTTTRWQFDSANLVIDLPVRAYNLVRRRSAGITPLYLIVVCLHPDDTRRLDISPERMSIAGRAFWWCESRRGVRQRTHGQPANSESQCADTDGFGDYGARRKPEARLMIDATLSIRSAEEISGSELAKYLAGQGWTLRPSKLDGVSIASLPNGRKEPLWVAVPLEDRFVDYRSKLAAVLRTLSAIEDRPENEIARSIVELARRDPAFVAAA